MDVIKLVPAMRTLLRFMPHDRALELVRHAHGLTKEQTEQLSRKTK